MTSPHCPCIAYGKVRSRSLSGGNKPAAGATALTFSNVSGPIIVGDPVFCCDQSAANNQFLGLCTASSATGITVTAPLETAPATSLTIWVPTQYAFFEFAEDEFGGQVLGYYRGVVDVISAARTALPYQYADAYETIRLSLNSTKRENAASAHLFIKTYRRHGIDSFALGWYDQKEQDYRVDKCKIQGDVEFTQSDTFVVSLTLTALIEAEDTYVDA